MRKHTALGLLCSLCLKLVFVLMFHSPSFGQKISTSVQGVVNVLPPYTLHLSDYTDVSEDKLQVSLFLDDPTATPIQVKLRITLQSDKLTITTKPEYAPPPLTLENKDWLNLSGAELADYFKPEHMNIQGSLVQGRLPEGVYRFGVEVEEYHRHVLLSNMIWSAPVWLILNDPPMWQMPRMNEVVGATFPQNLFFNWVPRHTGSPNAALDVSYRFRIEPLYNDQVNPQAIFLQQSTFTPIETDQTSLIFGPDQVALEPGQKYAVRVQAIDNSGRDLFRNNGFSEVLLFTFGQKCLIPSDPAGISHSYKQASVSWTGNAGNSRYTLSYREKGQAVWYTQTTELTSVKLDNLHESTQYEIKLSAACNSLVSEETAITTFTTPSIPVNTFTCNDPTVYPALSSVPKASLIPGNIIKIKNFTLKIIQVSGSNGKFTGKGILAMPFLKNVGLEATFSNIGVNADNWLTSGRVEVISGQVQIINEQTRQEITNLGSSLKETVPSQTPQELIEQVNGLLAEAPKLPPFAKAYIEQGRDQMVQGQAMIAAGNTQEGQKMIDKGRSTLQQGLNKAGSAFDKPSGIISLNAKPKTLNTDPNLIIKFDKTTTTQYGYDAYKDPLLKTKYEKVIDETTKGEIYPDWKALESGKPDEVRVSITASGSYKADSVKFEDENGKRLPPPQRGGVGGGALTLIGGTDGSDTRIYATFKTGKEERRLAQINTASYDKISNKLIIVPIGNEILDASAITHSINLAYKQAIAEFTVEVKPVYNLPTGWDQNKDGKMDVGNSGLLSNYTKEMRHVIDGYTANDQGLDDDTYYLFVGIEGSEAGLKGYMPRAKHYGFIFTPLSTGVGLKTIAHELGHGVFHLKHTFDETSVPKGSSQNLMDYTDQGTFLNKYQWDYVHNPAFVIGLLEGDDAGAMGSCWMSGLGGDCKNVPDIIKNIRDKNLSKTIISTKAFQDKSSVYLTAANISISNTSYEGVLINNYAEPGKIYKINPLSFSKEYGYSNPSKNDPKDADFYKFIFKDESDLSKTVLVISMFDKDLEKKRKLFENYLLGIDPGSKGNYVPKYIYFKPTYKYKDMLSDAALKEADDKLAELDKIGKKTAIYFAYCYYPDGTPMSIEGAKQSKIKLAKEELKTTLNASSNNLIILSTWNNPGSSTNVNDYTKTFEETFTVNNLQPVCEKAINDELAKNATPFNSNTDPVQALGTSSHDEALKYRAILLYDNLKDCKKLEVNPNTVKFGNQVSQEFLLKANQIAQYLGVDLNNLMVCMAFETGQAFKSNIVNNSSNATGLIQFLPSTAKSLGTTIEDLSKMTEVQQLDYVEKYFEPYKGKLNTIEDVYMAILYPSAVGKSNDYVLFSKGSIAYKNNPMDWDEDGNVTKSEASKVVSNMLNK